MAKPSRKAFFATPTQGGANSKTALLRRLKPIVTKTNTMDDTKNEFFTDGIGQIHFAGGMVRLDLMTLQPSAEEGKPPTSHSRTRLVMPPQGFLAAFNSMRQLIDKLVAAGVLKKNTNA